MNFPGFGFANICPDCNLQGSSVSNDIFGAFNSTFVNSSQCISTNRGTVLNVTGFGTLINGPSIVQGTFMLQLLETLVGDDEVIFSVSGFDQNGIGFAGLAILTVPDEDIMINFCNSLQC